MLPFGFNLLIIEDKKNTQKTREAQGDTGLHEDEGCVWVGGWQALV